MHHFFTKLFLMNLGSFASLLYLILHAPTRRKRGLISYHHHHLMERLCFFFSWEEGCKRWSCIKILYILPSKKKKILYILVYDKFSGRRRKSPLPPPGQPTETLEVIEHAKKEISIITLDFAQRWLVWKMRNKYKITCLVRVTLQEIKTQFQVTKVLFPS